MERPVKCGVCNKELTMKQEFCLILTALSAAGLVSTTARSAGVASADCVTGRE